MESEEQNAASLFRMTTIFYFVTFAFQAVAALLSAVVIIALLKPLRAQPSGGPGGQPTYSTYNLYLVHLALVDFVYLLIQITVEGTVISQGGILYVPQLAIMSITPYVFANMWINSIIVYQVLFLLKSSKYTGEITEPSLTTVHLQAGVLIVGAILSYVVLSNGVQTGWLPYKAFVYVTEALAAVPMLFLIGVAFFIPSSLPPSDAESPNDKAARGLTFFFSRVILVFLVLWIPTWLLGFFMGVQQEWVVFVHVSMLFAGAVQPILKFGIILTKPDVKKYITDLPYICLGRSPPANATQQGGQQGTTMLGYTFSDINGNGGAIGSRSNTEQVRRYYEHR